MITIEVEGLDEAMRDLDRMTHEAVSNIERAIAAATLLVRNNAVKRIQRGSKTGRLYMRGVNSSIEHRASAPGESPATDSGRLVNSITTKASGLTGSVDVNARYGFWLEYGTRNMAARPFLRPALDDEMANIVGRIEAALERAARTVD